MTEAEIRAAIDAGMATVLPRLIQAQQMYFATHGRYAQMLPTHTVTPADGVATAPDNLAARPDYQAESGAELAGLAGLPDVMQACVWCDTYAGPHGPGYVLNMEVLIGGVRERKAFNVGMELERSHDWAQLAGFPGEAE